MKRFTLSPAARSDIDEIWDYTAERWGAAQAERYIGDIRDACIDLAAGRRVSQRVDIREGYRKLGVGSHILFFRSDDAGDIVVVRILHKRMDVEGRL